MKFELNATYTPDLFSFIRSTYNTRKVRNIALAKAVGLNKKKKNGRDSKWKLYLWVRECIYVKTKKIRLRYEWF